MGFCRPMLDPTAIDCAATSTMLLRCYTASFVISVVFVVVQLALATTRHSSLIFRKRRTNVIATMPAKVTFTILQTAGGGAILCYFAAFRGGGYGSVVGEAIFMSGAASFNLIFNLFSIQVYELKMLRRVKKLMKQNQEAMARGDDEAEPPKPVASESPTNGDVAHFSPQNQPRLFGSGPTRIAVAVNNLSPQSIQRQWLKPGSSGSYRPSKIGNEVAVAAMKDAGTLEARFWIVSLVLLVEMLLFNSLAIKFPSYVL